MHLQRGVATMASERKTGMAAQKNGKHEMKWELTYSELLYRNSRILNTSDAHAPVCVMLARNASIERIVKQYIRGTYM